MKPVIGITCSQGTAGAEDAAGSGTIFDLVKREYHRRIEESGGVPVLLPVVQDLQTAREMMRIIDGLLLTGGDDMDPAFYGEQNVWQSSVICQDRDRFELCLLRCADERNIAVFGICRGLQVMNVHYGGSLYQDVSLRPGSGTHRSEEPHVYLRHPVDLVRGGRLAALAGCGSVDVTSRHHQIVKRVAADFVPTAFAPDGVIEAIESGGSSRFRIGVQWHPELMAQDGCARALFSDFVAAAGKRT